MTFRFSLSTRQDVAAVLAASLIAAAATARAQPAPPGATRQTNVPAAVAAQLAPVTITGNYDNAVGTSDTASQGSVTPG